MKEIVKSRQRLPDLELIQVDHISDKDACLDNFLRESIPARLSRLTINWPLNSKNPWVINSNYYIKAFSRAVERTTKNVYFYSIDFSARNLQIIVKAAWRTEEIVFKHCCIHCSSDLNFGADLRYRTQYLSFQEWEYATFEEKTTDWKTDPSSFSLIVDAIGCSKLKNSLKKLNISNNKSLSKIEVEKQLIAKNMQEIEVVDNESPLPFEF